MINVCLTYAQTNAHIADRILYSKTTGFVDTISELVKIKANTENCHGWWIVDRINISRELEFIIQLFQSFHVREATVDDVGHSGSGYEFYIKDTQTFLDFVNEYAHGSCFTNIWKAWLFVLQVVNCAIDRFYRTQNEDTFTKTTFDDIVFLQNILTFLSYSCVIEGDVETWIDLRKKIQAEKEQKQYE